ncbi:hypothetical protein GALMADRAFT_1176511 [Galerina marginata CBS 339.88]|uniref:Protein kinase domain-containing protein n=1 Tax=Galerina marginata (strain CBS 339.88) TaxID=685588 RepID=A0A067TJF8_GALM3|nr:hypothetical protein GALMADRAFT_1176511 [Galerina marginata CBS 339.88]
MDEQKTDGNKPSGLLLPSERFWVNIQPLLLKHGYRLRPRYDPDWVPSWIKQKTLSTYDPASCPDAISTRWPNLLDAVRVSDGTKVVVKKVYTHEDIPVLEFLTSPKLLADPRNNTVPILDVIPLPNDDVFTLIVMPFLYNFESDLTPFRHVSEVLDALKQFIQGLAFLHEQRIAHRDICYLNLMMDPTKVIPGGFHFVKRYLQDDLRTWIVFRDRRSVSPVKYYIVDYEFARFYAPGEKSIGRMGQDRTVPEMSNTIPYDPFKTDVYQLGRTIPRLSDAYDGLDFLKPLGNAMTEQDPEKRVTAAEAFERYLELVSSLNKAHLSRRIWPRNKSRPERLTIIFSSFWRRHFMLLFPGRS